MDSPKGHLSNCRQPQCPTTQLYVHVVLFSHEICGSWLSKAAGTAVVPSPLRRQHGDAPGEDHAGSTGEGTSPEVRSISSGTLYVCSQRDWATRVNTSLRTLDLCSEARPSVLVVD